MMKVIIKEDLLNKLEMECPDLTGEKKKSRIARWTREGFSHAMGIVNKHFAFEAKPEKYCYNDNKTYHEVDEFRCSACGIHIEDWNRVVQENPVYIKEYRFKYCPECGAKVTGEEK